MTRRDFIGTSAIFTAASYRNIYGANNQINLGFIGVGCKDSRGTGLLEKCCLPNPQIEAVAVCDVYRPYRERAARIIEHERHRRPAVYEDFRELLAQPDIDAVVIATPDHWHALMTIMACQAGKDVYLEKPCSHSIAEEPFMIKAMTDNARIVQVGAQGSSNRSFQDAVSIIQSGILGRIHKVETWIYWLLGLETQPATPEGLNWDMWLGPAPYHDFEPGRFRFSWRLFHGSGGGMLPDWGPHLFGVVLDAMNQKRPETVTAVGTEHEYSKDIRDAPDSISVTYKFPGFICTFENAPGDFQGQRKRNHGIEFIGKNGVLTLSRNEYEVTAGTDKKLEPPLVNGRLIPLRGEKDGKETEQHMDNFIECIRTREKPAGSLDNHYATGMAHYGNIAYRSRQTVFVEQKTGTIAPASLHKYLGREYRAPWKLEI